MTVVVENGQETWENDILTKDLHNSTMTNLRQTFVLIPEAWKSGDIREVEAVREYIVTLGKIQETMRKMFDEKGVDVNTNPKLRKVLRIRKKSDKTPNSDDLFALK